MPAGQGRPSLSVPLSSRINNIIKLAHFGVCGARQVRIWFDLISRFYFHSTRVRNARAAFALPSSSMYDVRVFQPMIDEDDIVRQCYERYSTGDSDVNKMPEAQFRTLCAQQCSSNLPNGKNKYQ